ncbi:MAG: ATPase, T2SS/T4P/T4SS family [Spirochaetales bacterium]
MIDEVILKTQELTSQEKAELEKKERLMCNLFGDMKALIKYLDDAAITDIAVQDTGEIIVSKFGKGRVCTGEALSDVSVRRIILSCAAVVGAKIDAYAGLSKLEAVIPKYNARITALLPPQTLRHVISIRKPAKIVYSLEQYVQNKQMSEEQYELIVSYIKERKNIIIAGSTGSGKTTCTNAIIKKMEEFTPFDNFYIVEDVPELQCNARMRVSVCTSKEHAAEAVEEALRFNPDRIIFGEVRNSRVMNALVTAWNTGHSGSVTTIHANNCESTLLRIKKLLKNTEDGNNEQLSDVIHLVVHLKKTSEGIRVDEILPVHDSDDDFIDQLEKNGLG